jgi:hypothetical protein
MLDIISIRYTGCSIKTKKINFMPLVKFLWEHQVKLRCNPE